ncbi:hypothetical protein F8M41_018615 [Gigaspora margarita]|uniref:Restriction endonuclease type IV Mrr domain-containing protein n=1 Tax=Gigaspora margarita TaxID=4874 RepID=A0A8H4EL66_GIGMA|nr:hypothetical protein F8M41_018615 [Gigaspora margarita]
MLRQFGAAVKRIGISSVLFISLIKMYFEAFVRYINESSQALGMRFEEFCEELLVRTLRQFGVVLKRIRKSRDGGRDIIIRICEFREVMQCKAYFNQNIDILKRKHVDELRTVMWVHICRKRKKSDALYFFFVY